MFRSVTHSLSRLVRMLVLPIRLVGRPLPMTRERQRVVDIRRLSDHLRRDIGLSP